MVLRDTSRPVSRSHTRSPPPGVSRISIASNPLVSPRPAPRSSIGSSEDGDSDSDDGRGLEETLEKLGFGAYQWRLFALCGCGWMSDNSALQCIAVILPRVAIHFNLGSEVVGVLSASTMAGMMVGAVGWGVVSDILGRAIPFHSTLLLTALFGIFASFSPSFPVLCIWLFCLGTAVGGSMPTDGTLFLENLPHSKQYLLTLLSVFFSIGAVLSSVVGLMVLPQKSCKVFEGCDIAGGANDGWRHVLLVLGLFNLLCALARFVLVRLHESPRFLVANGRSNEAVISLRAIATFNDHSMDIGRADVRQQEAAEGPPPEDTEDIEETYTLMNDSDMNIPAPTSPSAPLSPVHSRSPLRNMRGGRGGEGRFAWWHSWRGQMAKLFSPKWRRTVILMWIIWGSMAFAYTMFNVWLPAVLEQRQGDSEQAILGALRDFVLYAVAGCPGSIIGAWMIQTRLGRRRSLAACTMATAVAMFAFMRVRANLAVTISSMFVSLTGTAMYAVLYGMTPETFGTSIRGTACGTSAALSRLAGVIAPVAAGFLLTLTPNLPLITSAVVYGLTALCSLALPKDRERQGGGGGAAMH